MYSSTDPTIKWHDYMFSAKEKYTVPKVWTTFKSVACHWIINKYGLWLPLSGTGTYSKAQFQVGKVFKLTDINGFCCSTVIQTSLISLPPFNALHSATYFLMCFTWIQRIQGTNMWDNCLMMVPWCHIHSIQDSILCCVARVCNRIPWE